MLNSTQKPLIGISAQEGSRARGGKNVFRSSRRRRENTARLVNFIKHATTTTTTMISVQTVGDISRNINVAHRVFEMTGGEGNSARTPKPPPPSPLINCYLAPVNRIRDIEAPGTNNAPALHVQSICSRYQRKLI